MKTKIRNLRQVAYVLRREDIGIPLSYVMYLNVLMYVMQREPDERGSKNKPKLVWLNGIQKGFKTICVKE